MTDFDSRLGTALHDRVAGVHPDLDHLVAASTRAGTRIRLRRRAGVSLAAATGVAVVAVGGAQIAGGSDPRQVDGGFAAEPRQTASAAPTPTKAPLADGLVFSLHGRDVTVSRWGHSWVADLDSEAPQSDVAAVKELYPRITAVTPWEALPPLVDHVPVTFSAPGWTCDLAGGDDKGGCTADDGRLVSVIWRRASDYAAFTAKSADDGYFVSKVHDGLFVTLQPGQGTSKTAADELGATLHWVD
ncbi:hypothetical protein [Nocardioides sp. CER19]|uniref:hypothetical protein n=1 Tax=Nocardioides sp. CER19 TaxID=3038538 RepID=UPI002448EBE4|nr:hypothetical protein [Nocardioides sp. CER19]MDH2416390.1 hypothetical protein [Nocardioides sp. CER19]